MTEQELRQLVRETIARVGAASRALQDPEGPVRGHAAFALIDLPVGADGEGSCIIEPAVPCNHCGYCKSYGH